MNLRHSNLKRLPLTVVCLLKFFLACVYGEELVEHGASERDVEEEKIHGIESFSGPENPLGKDAEFVYRNGERLLGRYYNRGDGKFFAQEVYSERKKIPLRFRGKFSVDQGHFDIGGPGDLVLLNIDSGGVRAGWFHTYPLQLETVGRGMGIRLTGLLEDGDLCAFDSVDAFLFLSQDGKALISQTSEGAVRTFSRYSWSNHKVRSEVLENVRYEWEDPPNGWQYKATWLPLPYWFEGKWYIGDQAVVSNPELQINKMEKVGFQPFRNAHSMDTRRDQPGREFTTQNNLSLYANTHGLWDDFSASVAPSGKIAATLNEGVLKIWDIGTRHCIWTLRGIGDNYFWDTQDNIIDYSMEISGRGPIGYVRKFDIRRKELTDLGGMGKYHAYSHSLNKALIFGSGGAGDNLYDFTDGSKTRITAIPRVDYQSIYRKNPVQADRYKLLSARNFGEDPGLILFDLKDGSVKQFESIRAFACLPDEKSAVMWHQRGDVLLLDYKSKALRSLYSNVREPAGSTGREQGTERNIFDILTAYPTMHVDSKGEVWCAVYQSGNKAVAFSGSISKPSSVGVRTTHLINSSPNQPVYPMKSGDILYVGLDFGAYHWSERLKDTRRVGDSLALSGDKVFVDGRIFNPADRSFEELPEGWAGVHPSVDGLLVAELDNGARKLVDTATGKVTDAMPRGFLPVAQIDRKRFLFSLRDAASHQVRAGIFDVSTSQVVGYLGSPLKFNVKWRDYRIEKEAIEAYRQQGGEPSIMPDHLAELHGRYVRQYGEITRPFVYNMVYGEHAEPDWIFDGGKSGEKLCWRDQEFDFSDLELRDFKILLTGNKYLPDTAKVSLNNPTWESYLEAAKTHQEFVTNNKNKGISKDSVPVLLGDGREVCIVQIEDSSNRSVAGDAWCSPSGRLVAMVSDSYGPKDNFEDYNEACSWTIIDTKSKRFLRSSRGSPVLLFKPLDDTGERVAVVTGNNIYIVDYINGKVLSQEGCPYPDRAVCSADGSRIFVSSSDGTVYCYGHDSHGVLELLFELRADALGHWVISSKGGFYMTRGGERLVSISLQGTAQAFSTDQFSLRLNRPDIILKRIGAPDEAIAIAKQLRAKRLRRMGVTEDMLKPDFHLPELSITRAMPLTSSSDSITIPISASDSRYELERLHVYVNNVPVNGRDGESLRVLSTRQLSRDIPIKLANGRNKIQVSVVNSAGAESLYSNVEVTCTASSPKPVLYTVALGVSSYSNPEFDLRYAAKDAKDIIASLHSSAGENYREVKSLCLTDKEVTREAIPQIRDFLSLAGINDTVIFFVAGHGLLDAGYDYYFATTDVDFDSPAERGVAFDELDAIMADVACLKKTMWIDTCHAGELDEEERTLLAANSGAGATSLPGGSGVAVRSVGTRGMSVRAIETAATRSEWYERLQGLFVDLRRGSGTTVLTSSAGAEYALESSEQQNGLFTYALIEALKGSKAADEDRNGSITISEAADYVKSRVEQLSNGKQNPNVRRVNLEEDFILYEEE